MDEQMIEDVPLTVVDLLSNLSDAVARRRHYEHVELQCVVAARARGASWAEIAGVYGVSRQAAHAKWSKMVKDSHD